ncbi:MAG: guanylate kinase [Ruminococcus sp.]
MSDMNNTKRGTLFVYTGASGVGKGTIMKELLSIDSNLRLSVSDTTRDPRPGEIPGVHYNYITREQFEATISEGGYLEYTQYCGNYYGSPKKPIEEMLKEGLDVILEIEVEGGKNIISQFPDAVSLFILPPDMETLERRLRKRGTESEEQIKKRLEKALYEINFADRYMYNIVNGDLQVAVDEILSIIRKETGRELTA